MSFNHFFYFFLIIFSCCKFKEKVAIFAYINNGPASEQKTDNMKKKTFLKYLAALLGVNLTSSCLVALYASPHADYEAKGRVSDEEGNPIPGIMVDLAVKHYNETEGTVTTEPMDNVKTATADDGSFHVVALDQWSFPDSVTVLFTDVDGMENGGEFLPKEVTVPVVKKKDGEGGWDEGLYGPSRDIEVNLERVPEVKK